MNTLTLGYIPVTDCLPLVVAKHQGFFEQHGLTIELLKQNSWATLRDKLHAGLIDAAHMLAPMPIASTLGLGVVAEPIITPFVLSRYGNGITLSLDVFDEILPLTTDLNASLPLPASRLRALIRRRAEAGEKLTIATVFPYSCHFYQLRSWLLQSDIPIDAVNIVITPPPHLVEALSQKEIDGFCAGGPWNAHAVRAKKGVTVATSCDIWPSMPEKVLGLTEQFFNSRKDEVYALVRALYQACEWLREVPNRYEAARVLHYDGYLEAPMDVIATSLIGSCLTHPLAQARPVPQYNIFGCEVGAQNNVPAGTQGEWILNQMCNAGHVDLNQVNTDVVARIFREDIHHDALLGCTLHHKSEENSAF